MQAELLKLLFVSLICFACISKFWSGKSWPAEPELEGCRWAKDVGREAGAGKPLLKTIFQVRSKSESTAKVCACKKSVNAQ